MMFERLPNPLEQPEQHLPDCMMPDGAEPCAGFQEERLLIIRQQQTIVSLERKNRLLREALVELTNVDIAVWVGKIDDVAVEMRRDLRAKIRAALAIE